MALNLLNGLLSNLSSTDLNDNKSDPEPYFVANTSEFNNKDRKVAYIPYKDRNGKCCERPIILLKVLNNYYALDLRCYHVGGSLLFGDIEDIDGNLCIKCQYHGYTINIENGEGLFPNVGLDPITKKEKTVYFSRGKRQRKHKVIVNTNTNKIYVVLNSDKTILDSDKYAYKSVNDK